MTVDLHLAPAKGASDTFPWGEVLAAPLAAGPCLVLAWSGGGLSTGAQAVAHGWVFLALAAWAIVQQRAGIATRVPAFWLLILAWPLWQMMPLSAELAARVLPQRAAEMAEFARAGLSPAGTISLYPYATGRMFLAVAGAVALFLLVRGMARRGRAALEALAAGVVLLGLAEALLALRQYFLIQAGAAGKAGPGSDFIRGTFGNRNLLAAWLEGCYGVALGLMASRWEPGDEEGSGRAPWLPALLAAGAAWVLTAAVLCSFSRMGTACLAGETLLMALFVWRGSAPGARRALAALVVGMALGAVAIGLPDLGRRYRPAALAEEKQGRLAMWKDAIAAARRCALWGAGAGAFPFAFRRSHPYLTDYTIDHPHNEYLETAVEWGVPATLLLAGAGVVALGRSWRGLRRASGRPRWLGLGCLAGVGGMLLHAGVDFPLRIPALLSLVAVLLGMMAAATRPCRSAGSSSEGVSAAGRASAVAVVVAALGLAAVSLWSSPLGGRAPRGLEQWNAEWPLRAARDALEAGRLDEAEAGCRRALRLNPYAAAAWNELALVAEARGDRAAALEWSGMAERLEPHSRRGQWAAGNLRLRLGDVAGAMRLFRELVVATPEMRRPAWEVCWTAGAPRHRIFEELAAPVPGGVEEYFRYLLEREHRLRQSD